MDRRLRVLVLTSLFPNRPGDKQGNFVLDQVRALSVLGVEVTVLVAKPLYPLPFLAPVNKRKIEESTYRGEGFRIRNASFFSLPRYVLGVRAFDFLRVGLSSTIDAIEQEFGFDVIHAHGFPLGSVANCVAKTRNIPSVMTVHGIETHPRFDDTELKKQYLGRIIDEAAEVVLVGSPLIPYCKRYAPQRDHFALIGNGCTVYPDLKPSLRIPKRKPLRVAAVSNYEESKGFDLLAEAMAQADLRDKIELVIVGGGHGFRKVQGRVHELGLTDSVHFTGLLSHREALAEVMAADIFCLPSWREAFGIMYAEAMALGKLTIGCARQGPSDFMQHMETGYLIEPGSTDAVVAALRWAIENPAPAADIARRGKDYALRNLTWAANARRMIEIYRSLLVKQTALETPRSSLR